MNDRPLVSVITPSFNQGRFIEETIRSVLSQDYPRIEYWVIDGGSTDGTLEILRRYEGRLKWLSEPDRGQTDAINKGFRIARGDVLCWLNSDDTYEPGAVRATVEYFEAHPQVMMIYGEGNEIDEQGRLIQRFPATQPFDLWTLIYVWDYILQPTTFFRKDALRTVGLLDERYHWCMDWDLWIRIGSRFRVEYLSRVMANSRIYADTKTGSGGFRRFREIVSVMRRYGRRRYPLGYFIFGEDTLENVLKEKFPRFFLYVEKLFLKARIALNERRIIYQGVYGDGWLGKKARFMIPNKFIKSALINWEIELPRVTELFPNVLQVKVNGKRAGRYHLDHAGCYTVETHCCLENEKLIEGELVFDRSFVPDEENRRMTCYLHRIEVMGCKLGARL